MAKRFGGRYEGFPATMTGLAGSNSRIHLDRFLSMKVRRLVDQIAGSSMEGYRRRQRDWESSALCCISARDQATQTAMPAASPVGPAEFAQ